MLFHPVALPTMLTTVYRTVLINEGVFLLRVFQLSGDA